ncbi:MAG: ABC transporter permease [Pelagibacterium sp. SCN 64-44]|nr:MAG: ABC transporter permease [Pelagibacterium sp. SCN 64-44]
MASGRAHPRFPKGLFVPLTLILLAEAAWHLSGFVSDSIAPPSKVAIALIQGLLDGRILLATRDTLISAFSGLAIGGVLGLVMGLVRGTFWRVDAVLEVTTETIRPIPSVALIPVAILIFGFGYELEITLVAISCMFTIFILTRAAIVGVERRMIEVGRMLRLSFFDRMRKIVIPAALPRIFVAFRLGAGLSLIVAVTTEIAANPIGMGAAMMLAQQSLNPGLTVAYLVWIGFIGWLLNHVLITLQRRFFSRYSFSALDEK